MDNIPHIALKSVDLSHRGILWQASLDGQIIVERSRDPEHDAARALLALGRSGPFITTDEAGQPWMRFPSIAAAAGMTVGEERRDGLRHRRWDGDSDPDNSRPAGSPAPGRRSGSPPAN